MKRHLLLGRKAVTNLGSILKSRDVTLLTKVCVVRAVVFLIVVHQCDSWSIKKTERRRTDFFKSFIIIIMFTLQYCIGFAIHHHASATGVHVFPILNTPPTSLPIPSLWVIPGHQPQASCILHRTWTGNSFLIWYYTCFNSILPNHPPRHQQSPKDCSIHLCLFCCFAYSVVITIFLNSMYMR